MNLGYKCTIGLEVHANLNTKAKLFSKATNSSTLDAANSNVALLDLGMPGALPVLNPEAVGYAVRACLSLGMKVREQFTFDRKSYMYPDLPLGYQITQFYEPIGIEGSLPIYVGDVKRNIKIRQLHLETDAGKSLHQDDYTLLDYNRCGSPLVEIVTYPDMSNAEEVIFFIRLLRSTLKHIGVSDANMELGDFRIDVSISASKTDALGTRVEIKNLNSFRSIRKAIDYEFNRQIELLENGEQVKQETRSFDDKMGRTIFMRTKENAYDYMYFREPDLPTFILDEEVLITQQSYVRDLPHIMLEQLSKRFGVKDIMLNLVEEPFISRFVRNVLEDLSIEEQKQALKVILGEIFARLKDIGPGQENMIPISYVNFRKLIKLILKEQLNTITIKSILDDMWESDEDPFIIIENKGLKQIRDPNTIRNCIQDVLKANPDELQRYVGGKTNLRAFFIGQTMKKCGNSIDIAILNQILDEELGKYSSN